jgi:ATP-dependent helicase/nuclease subunit A
MTIHASKGLEAPVVFLADSARGAGSDRPFRALVEWPAESPRPETMLLVGKKGQQPTFTREVLEHEQEEVLREDANLLYVAVTRARQQLYLSACAPRRGDDLGWYGAMRRALDPLDEKALDEPCTLQSGNPPIVVVDSRSAEPTGAAPAIPDALSLPLTITPLEREIAPSFHQADGQLFDHYAGDEDGRQRGIAIHRLLQLMTENPGAAQSGVTARVAQELGMNSNDSELLQWVGEAEQLLCDPELQKLLLPGSDEASNEVPIIYTEEGLTVHGIIDRLVLRESEAWVIDYKTHRGVSTETLAAQAAPFRRQLQYYAEGVQRLWPDRHVRRFLLFTHGRQLYEFA